jgi:extracellular factor (EF) 3-hydroxypalmitic acid methyl ester biosynthesis protein
MENSFVSSNFQGFEMRGTILRLERFQVIFEIYEVNVALRISEVLNELKVFIDGDLAYSGRAVVTNLMSTGAVSACEVKLDDPGVQPVVSTQVNGYKSFREAYHTFFGRWQNQVKVLPEFKIAVSDLQSYLWELKLLLEQIELSVLGHPSRNRSETELEVSQDLAQPVLLAIDAMHERFEEAAGRIEPELRGPHEASARRQLHPLFLCAPFGHRTYHKPLGYAGDYEIMNMIHRNTFEGGSMYAKMVHYWLVSQWAAKSVRNRIARMKTKLAAETVRVTGKHRPARILNLGCGPAREVQDFMAESSIADHAEFTLLDFDAETLDFVTSKLAETKRRHGRRTQIQTRRMSVTQLLKYASQPARSPLGAGFDLVYCTGLLDYLSERLCKQLVGMFYELLAPGGLVVVANMDDHQKPFRHMVEFLLDWHLLYRNPRSMSAWVPEAAPVDSWSLVSEPVAVNMFLEVRKPERN